jgi:hypothetical protein
MCALEVSQLLLCGSKHLLVLESVHCKEDVVTKLIKTSNTKLHRVISIFANYNEQYKQTVRMLAKYFIF